VINAELLVGETRRLAISPKFLWSNCLLKLMLFGVDKKVGYRGVLTEMPFLGMSDWICVFEFGQKPSWHRLIVFDFPE
jgi:hypothetical protein